MVLLVEVKEESGKSFWKNRVESWKGKDKKNKKKKAAPKVENETSVPPEQKMEEARWVLWEMTQISWDGNFNIAVFKSQQKIQTLIRLTKGSYKIDTGLVHYANG